MAEFTKEEVVQEVLDRVLQSSTGVEDLETVSSLAGVKSLPGEKDGLMVVVPLHLLSQPATDAAARADSAARNAQNSLAGLEEKTKAATEAAAAASDAALNATNAADKVERTTGSAMKGATMRFGGIEERVVNVEALSAVGKGGIVVYVRSAKRFAYKLKGRFYSSWRVDGIPDPDMYMSGFVPHQDKLYISGSSLYIFTGNDLSLFAHRHEVLSEEAYESLASKDDATIYMIYEEE